MPRTALTSHRNVSGMTALQGAPPLQVNGGGAIAAKDVLAKFCGEFRVGEALLEGQPSSLACESADIGSRDSRNAQLFPWAPSSSPQTHMGALHEPSPGKITAQEAGATELYRYLFLKISPLEGRSGTLFLPFNHLILVTDGVRRARRCHATR